MFQAETTAKQRALCRAWVQKKTANPYNPKKAIADSGLLYKFFQKQCYDLGIFKNERKLSPVAEEAKPWFDKCSNDIDIISQEPFTIEQDDDIVRIYPTNLSKAHCIARDDIKESIMANTFSTIMVEWVPRKDEAVVGSRRSISKAAASGSNKHTHYVPGKRMFAKLPLYNIYVTLESFRDIVKQRKVHVKEWQLVEVERVRLGNIEGILGRSMNHAQGDEIVYRAVKKADWDALISIANGGITRGRKIDVAEKRARLLAPRPKEYSANSQGFLLTLEKHANKSLEELREEVEREILADMESAVGGRGRA